MHAVAAFALAPLAPSGDEQTGRSRLLFAGRGVLDGLSGVSLEAQFQIDGEYLLLVTEDCPFEEALNIYLLSPRFDLLDAAELSAPYSPGVVADLEVAGPRQLDFTFIGKNHWRLTVEREPRFSLPSPYLRRPLRRWLQPQRLHIAHLGCVAA